MPCVELPFTPARVYLCFGVGSGRENKLARDAASAQCGLENLTIVSGTSVLPPGIRLIDRDEFAASVGPGQVIHAIHGVCESHVHGQTVSATLSLALPDDPAVTGYVAELYEYPGLKTEIAVERTETMLIELCGRRYGVPRLDPSSLWVAGRRHYVIGPHEIEVHTVHAETYVERAGLFACGLAAAVLLPKE